MKVNNISHDGLLLEANKAADVKITAFIELMNLHVDEKIEQIRKSLATKIEDVHNKIEKLRASGKDEITFSEQINIQSTVSKDEITRLDQEIKKMDHDVNESIKFTEDTLKHQIYSLEKEIKTAKADIDDHKKNVNLTEENIKSVQARITGATKPKVSNVNLEQPNNNGSSNKNLEDVNTELLICFDSNGKFIDRRKLWKVNNSIYKHCGTLYEVSKIFQALKPGGNIKYLLINVGVNDLDTKDHVHEQVYEGMKLLFYNYV